VPLSEKKEKKNKNKFSEKIEKKIQSSQILPRKMSRHFLGKITSFPRFSWLSILPVVGEERPEGVVGGGCAALSGGPHEPCLSGGVSLCNLTDQIDPRPNTPTVSPSTQIEHFREGFLGSYTNIYGESGQNGPKQIPKFPQVPLDAHVESDQGALIGEKEGKPSRMIKTISDRGDEMRPPSPGTKRYLPDWKHEKENNPLIVGGEEGRNTDGMTERSYAATPQDAADEGLGRIRARVSGNAGG